MGPGPKWSGSRSILALSRKGPRLEALEILALLTLMVMKVVVVLPPPAAGEERGLLAGVLLGVWAVLLLPDLKNSSVRKHQKTRFKILLLFELWRGVSAVAAAALCAVVVGAGVGGGVGGQAHVDPGLAGVVLEWISFVIYREINLTAKVSFEPHD